MILLAAKWILGRAHGLLRFIGAHPWQCAVIALLALSWALWERGDRFRDRLLAVQTAQVAAERLAKEALARQEQAYKDKAHAADLAYEARLVDARDDTERFIAAHRVRSGSPACQAVAPAESGSAGVPEAVPTGVVVEEADVRACGDLYDYAVSAHDWAVGLNRR